METAFEKTHRDRIVGKLVMVDRMIINGHLTGLLPPGYFELFLSRQGVLLKDFGRYVQRATAKVKEHALQLAAEAKRPYISLQGSVKGKDDLAKKIAARDGVQEGLICVLSAMEPRPCFQVRGNHKTHMLEITRRLRPCLHLYFYFMDAEFGFMHVRLQTWFPFQIQIYVNGREWLARQLEKRGVAFDRYQNSLLTIEDLRLAESLCQRFARRKWPRVLDAFARRVNPWLPVVRKFAGGHGYYWVVDECETATDVMFRNRARLREILDGLFDQAIRAFSAEYVLRFLGRRFPGRLRGEVVTDHVRRPEGRRIKHRIKSNWIKMYDKWSVLRIETTINNPGDFKVLRAVEGTRGRKTLRWMPMCKGISNLPRYIEVSTQANERYLEALGELQPHGEAVALLDELCRSRTVEGKRYPRFNPVSEHDSGLFRAVMAGEHAVNGFRNRDLTSRLYSKPSTDPVELKRRCARVCRLIAKLRGHGLVSKVPRSRLYRISARGRRVMAAALYFREVAFATAATAA